ncbi:hypothetical protein [Kibdelosporangium phytohabitans]|nr:hypothetical protein [Kibdelosporangium phytohabitans]
MPVLSAMSRQRADQALGRVVPAQHDFEGGEPVVQQVEHGLVRPVDLAHLPRAGHRRGQRVVFPVFMIVLDVEGLPLALAGCLGAAHRGVRADNRSRWPSAWPVCCATPMLTDTATPGVTDDRQPGQVFVDGVDQCWVVRGVRGVLQHCVQLGLEMLAVGDAGAGVVYRLLAQMALQGVQFTVVLNRREW